MKSKVQLWAPRRFHLGSYGSDTGAEDPRSIRDPGIFFLSGETALNEDNEEEATINLSTMNKLFKDFCNYSITAITTNILTPFLISLQYQISHIPQNDVGDCLHISYKLAPGVLMPGILPCKLGIKVSQFVESPSGSGETSGEASLGKRSRKLLKPSLAVSPLCFLSLLLLY